MDCIRRITMVCLVVVPQHAMYHYYPSPYRPVIFGGEPRLMQDWMTSFMVNLRGGSARHGVDACNNSMNVFCIYGPENIHALAQGVPQSILDCDPDCYFNNLWRLSSLNCRFGHVQVLGTLSLIEFTPTLIQNLNHGLFLSLTIPVNHTSIKDISFVDLTTPHSTGKYINFARWQTAANNLAMHLARYGTYVGPCTNNGLGDIQLLAGWGYNYEDFEVLDYVDVTLAAGVNFPTSRCTNPAAVFSVPLGYNGHWGVPCIACCSLGAFDWLTVGVRGGALWFLDKMRCVAMKTACPQNGWIKLTRGNACVHKGVIWHIEEYLKLDHFVENLSFLFGFGHDHATGTQLHPCDSAVFSSAIVNSDELLKPWTMNRFHCILEFDMATYQHPNFPRLAFTVDKAFSGKRIFKTAMFGSYVGVDLEWQL